MQAAGKESLKCVVWHQLPNLISPALLSLQQRGLDAPERRGFGVKPGSACLPTGCDLQCRAKAALQPPAAMLASRRPMRGVDSAVAVAAVRRICQANGYAGGWVPQHR